MAWEMYLLQCFWLLFLVLVPLIFPFGFLQSRFGWLALVCVGASVCCGWGPFLHCIPHEICQLCWKIKIVGVFYVWWLSAFSFWRISTKMCTFENPGGNLQRLYRKRLWFAKPKCSQRWPLANLAWASPLPNSMEIALSNVWQGFSKCSAAPQH